MPLLDHFQPPLYPGRSWESFHSQWATAFGAALNRVLPEGYYAEVQTHVGRIQVDVAAFEGTNREPRDRGGGGTATLVAPAYAPPLPALALAADFPDDIEVQIFSPEGGRPLVGAIELVSPGNKDRPEVRRAFAAKCSAYLQRGIGVIVVDIVTSRGRNLHDELMGLLGHGEATRFRPDSALYAVAYRPNRTDRQPTGTLDVWMAPLAVGGALPTLPLALRGGPCLAVDLEATYSEARQRSRLS